MSRTAVRLSIFFCLSLLFTALPSQAATFVVDSTADAVDANAGNGTCASASDGCTLRAAIQEANAFAGDDVITLPAGTYTLTIPGTAEYFSATGDLNIRTNVTINGAGSGTTIVQAGASMAAGIERVFDLRNNPNPTVVLNDITIRHGNAGAASAGGIYSDATLTMNRCIVTDNSAASNSGGGVFAESGSSLTLTDCVVANNVAVTGGGVYATGATTTLTITGSTIQGNSATGSGGGIRVDGGVTAIVSRTTLSGNTSTSSSAAIQLGSSDADVSSLTLTNCTISGHTGTGLIYTRTATTLSATNVTIANNSAGLSVSGAGATFRNTIIAGTTGNNCAGTPVSAGYNLSDDASCAAVFNQTGDQNSVDPLLGALALNSPGTTSTHALLAGSPAIDAGTATGAPSVDQRGVARPQGAAHDIGAYESDANPGVVGFEFLTASVDEADGQIVLTVIRESGADGTLTVDYSMTSGSAVAPGDFTSSTGTLTFVDGDTEETITIPIADDADYEGDETFTVSLSNVSAGGYNNQPAITVTIQSDDPAVVPTLSEWALLGLLAGLALAAMMLLRR